MNELKMGDIVEVYDYTNEWSDRIFIKYGKPGQIMYVNPEYEQNFRNNENFYTFTIGGRHWRVKQKPEYVPFTWEDREQLRGKWIKFKADNVHECCITSIFQLGISLEGNEYVDYKKLFNAYEFIDGTPCGKVKNE